MIVKLVRVFKCDHQYCCAVARVETSPTDYGTDTRKEIEGLRKRKWEVWGFMHYCPKHKGDAK